jgi:hypothetical protein
MYNVRTESVNGAVIAQYIQKVLRATGWPEGAARSNTGIAMNVYIIVC